MNIRKAQSADLPQLLELYTHLHNNPVPPLDDRLAAVWREILSDKNQHIAVGVVGGTLVSSCVVVIVPNLTHDQRPYALIENVVTHAAYRGKGYASQLLQYAKDLAASRGCYKIMLMTGSKEESTWRFYEKAGYNRMDKTAFVQWLE